MKDIGMKGTNPDRIKTLLQNNPSGAAAALNKQQDPDYKNVDNAEMRLNESIKNAHKLRMESAQNTEMAAKMQKVTQHSSHTQRGHNTQVDSIQAPARTGGSPHLEEVDDLDYLDLGELKMKHERLVDKILQEEDNLINNHHGFIESTINSSKNFLINF